MAWSQAVSGGLKIETLLHSFDLGSLLFGDSTMADFAHDVVILLIDIMVVVVVDGYNGVRFAHRSSLKPSRVGSIRFG